MPLIKSGSKKAISENIRELHTGKTYAATSAKFGAKKANAQAIAIALDTARRARKASGGSAIQQIPWAQRASSQRLSFEGGMLNSPIPGRTDKLKLNVPAGSYVIPSSVVSFLGQDNSAAGAGVLDAMFGRGPAGSRMSGRHNFRSPSARMGRRSARGFAAGGDASASDQEKVPILAAGGEYVIPADVLMERYGDIDHAHRILDQFVKNARAKHIETLKKLPGPVKA